VGESIVVTLTGKRGLEKKEVGRIQRGRSFRGGAYDGLPAVGSLGGKGNSQNIQYIVGGNSSQKKRIAYRKRKKKMEGMLSEPREKLGKEKKGKGSFEKN